MLALLLLEESVLLAPLALVSLTQKMVQTERVVELANKLQNRAWPQSKRRFDAKAP